MKHKILYIHHSVSKSGAARSLSFLIEDLDKNIYDPIVLCRKDNDNIDLFQRAGAKVIMDKRFGPLHGSTVSGMNFIIFCSNILKAIPTYFIVKKYINNIKPDIVHLNSTCMCVAGKASKKVDSNIPVLVHVREPLLENIFGSILKKITYRYVDGYIAIDKNDMESVIMLPEKPHEIIYNFVDFKKYNNYIKSEIIRNELSIPQEDTIFICLGRIVKPNGVIEMIDEFTKVYPKYLNYHLVIVGDELENSSKYIKLVRERCNKHKSNIHLLPFRKDVPELLASSDILICPFIEPHFSRAVIEAAAMGIPTIASNVGGVNELVLDGKTGLFFDYNDFTQLPELIKKLGSNKDLIKLLGKNAAKFARKNFDSKINAKRTVKFYERFLKIDK
ncbi:glycosyltransferase family 4 protein [Clostridium sp. YIM B02506]|uniref:glycosyltransferase family 4 protein n=1 Tax=Clostridium sp. YIM B02506 TaxID=2910680 RepID=UPI001EEF1726|nr:glycosyltransferase family 4 protein [Clostridium sp. YIM B02506]